jgi:AmmeMemoRadiSam system protein A
MPEENVNVDQQNFLLKLARDAIAFYIKKGKSLKATCREGALSEKRGAFVTLKKDGQLRGCIGYTLPQAPLCETVIDAAEKAAFQDFRFPPLERGELDEVRIEISVLGLPRRIKDPAEVEVGRHGILISRGGRRGLLLPQVPLEWDWDRETFLRHGCLKAGLEPEAWRDPQTRIEVFTAQVFSEA